MAKSDTFHCKATPEGGIFFTEYNRNRFKDWLKKNAGIYLTIKPERVESNKMRRFFEGAVVPLICYYQEDKDYHSSEDLYKVREWLKVEFNGELVILNGKKQLVGKSTSGASVLADFMERVIAWAEEQGYQTELLNPDQYKTWRDTIRPYSEIDNYIDYLKEIMRLK